MVIDPYKTDCKRLRVSKLILCLELLRTFVSEDGHYGRDLTGNDETSLAYPKAAFF